MTDYKQALDSIIELVDYHLLPLESKFLAGQDMSAAEKDTHKTLHGCLDLLLKQLYPAARPLPPDVREAVEYAKRVLSEP